MTISFGPNRQYAKRRAVQSAAIRASNVPSQRRGNARKLNEYPAAGAHTVTLAAPQRLQDRVREPLRYSTMAMSRKTAVEVGRVLGYFSVPGFQAG